VWSVFLLALVAGLSARAAEVTVNVSQSSPNLAFARYIASQQRRDAFGQSGPVGVLIEASLPELYKSAALVAVRRGSERTGMQLVNMAGDPTVAEEVIYRCLVLRRHIDAQPPAAIAITPANYKFHLAGEVKAGSTSAYIYEIAPKKNRPGLVGHLWVDADTGQEVMLSGRLMDMPAKGYRIDVVRDTSLMNGVAYARVTHIGFGLPLLGRAEAVITEVVPNEDMNLRRE
jgi:hypothetical protein